MTLTRLGPRPLSDLQRRLNVAEAHPERDWLILAENVPEWPSGTEPRPRVDATGAATGYAPSAGLPELRALIAERERTVNKGDTRRENVVVTAGAMHAIGLVFRMLAREGYRTVHAPMPLFRGVHDAIIDAGLTIVPIDLTEDHLMAIDGGRAVVYCNLPCNPTGAVVTPDIVELLAGAAARGAAVVYDATYDSFVFDGSVPTPVHLVDDYERFFVVNSLSKNYGRPGDRIGWVLAGTDALAHLVPQLEWETVCVNVTAQDVACQVIEHGNAALLDGVRAGRAAFVNHVAAYPVLHTPLPAGGTQLWLDLGVSDVEAFADGALERGLVLTSSSNYAPSAPGHVRLPLGIPAARMRRALELLSECVVEWSER